jgi:hypothetical protein
MARWRAVVIERDVQVISQFESWVGMDCGCARLANWWLCTRGGRSWPPVLAPLDREATRRSNAIGNSALYACAIAMLDAGANHPEMLLDAAVTSASTQW